MNNDRHQAALIRQRDKIANGLALRAIDDTTPGDHHMECSWGLCTTDWPVEDLARPDMPILGSKRREDHQKCPMEKTPGPNGCFHRCRVFQGPYIGREEAVQLYSILIACQHLIGAGGECSKCGVALCREEINEEWGCLLPLGHDGPCKNPHMECPACGHIGYSLLELEYCERRLCDACNHEYELPDA